MACKDSGTPVNAQRSLLEREFGPERVGAVIREYHERYWLSDDEDMAIPQAIQASCLYCQRGELTGHVAGKCLFGPEHYAPFGPERTQVLRDLYIRAHYTH